MKSLQSLSLFALVSLLAACEPPPVVYEGSASILSNYPDQDSRVLPMALTATVTSLPNDQAQVVLSSPMGGCEITVRRSGIHLIAGQEPTCPVPAEIAPRAGNFEALFHTVTFVEDGLTLMMILEGAVFENQEGGSLSEGSLHLTFGGTSAR